MVCFCKEVKACLKLFCCIGKNGALINILKVYNDSRCHLSFGIETTQVEKSPIEPVVNFNSEDGHGQERVRHIGR